MTHYHRHTRHGMPPTDLARAIFPFSGGTQSGQLTDILFNPTTAFHQESLPMLDDLEPLRDYPRLLELFCHYVQLGKSNRELWQPRRMLMEGVEASELTKLHGELIAFDWIEQNTGQTPCCYRITEAGLGAFLQMQNWQEDEVPQTTPFDLGKQAA